MHKKFDHQAIEKKWQEHWAAEGIYTTTENLDKPKAYVLDMFPYPSGEGLHVGHPKGYIATDIYSRFKRMTGHEVLHPMGWDAFGLPAENFAIKHKVHPRAAVEKNVARFKEQLSVLGFDYDWSREINTTDPEYYKWTQWIFVQLFKKGLAYESHEPINWCPGCQTGLANEDLESDGTCERCGSVVEKRPMRQWVLKIREYADRMLEDLDTLAWPEHIKEAQRNWIGRSEGAEISFELFFTYKPEANDNRGPDGEKAAISVFTTRPDTLFGATYMVLAPEHLWVTLATDDQHDVLENKAEVKAYVEQAEQKSEIERGDTTKDKTGVELKGVKAINPATGEQIPMYVADYVLTGYGTGAIMAVPGHDDRDRAFAKKFNLPVKLVVKDPKEYEHIDTNKLSELTRYIFEEAQKNNFIAVLIGSAARAIRETGALGVHSDIDVFVDKRGYEHLEKLFIARNYTRSNRAGHTTVHEWNNHNSFTGEGVWLDLFLLESNAAGELCDNIGAQTSVWGSKDLLEQVSFEGTDITISSVELDQKIGNTLSHNWNLSYTAAGTLKDSGDFSGMDSEEAKKAITEKVGGTLTSTYKIKDWVFSRQRYWGEPIPIIHCEKCGPVAVLEDQLPVILPEVEHYEPAGDGQSPLANITEWVNTTCPECGGEGERETNTMPQWAGSSWYYLRYMDPHNDQAPVSQEREQYWAPVDVYVGGDHAVRHLIYARFWHKFLYDIGIVSTIEPFQRLEFLGFILAEDGRKMSKRWGNVINPDDIVKQVGADTLRVYEMFMGPFENTIAWSQDGVVGACRFLERVNGLAEHITDTEPETVTRQLHKTIVKVTTDIEQFKFNTAVSSMMIFLNAAEKEGIKQPSYEIFLKLLAPFAPHVTEELWHEQGQQTSIHLEMFPQADPELAKDDAITIGVQINGKVRGDITIAPDAEESEAMTAVAENPLLQERLAGKVVEKIIYKPGKILNLIVSE